MQAIIRGLEKVKEELTASENDGPVTEVFRKSDMLEKVLFELEGILKLEWLKTRTSPTAASSRERWSRSRWRSKRMRAMMVVPLLRQGRANLEAVEWGIWGLLEVVWVFYGCVVVWIAYRTPCPKGFKAPLLRILHLSLLCEASDCSLGKKRVKEGSILMATVEWLKRPR
ncbi:Formin-like protein [Vigna angularis]|uniref:Formin-like protein n=1 Tax=Phaseolus angularis TaxID=3914 RepID=A0A8T0K7L4_PHAAN|nr:Formin-like protein [Vigna angularis]